MRASCHAGSAHQRRSPALPRPRSGPIVRGAMSALRNLLLTCLPKVALSRACGLACSIPLPRALRPRLFGWFARRYGADLGEAQGAPVDFRSMQEFFRRPLKPGARPIAEATLVWPCDGRVVTVGGIVGGLISTLSDNPATTFSEGSALGYMVVTFAFLGAILGALAGVIAEIVITRRDR